jgi:hypothetical protein
MTRLDRYRNGAHAEVWEELIALGDDASDSQHAEEVRAVAQETMRRLRVSAERLAASLTAAGVTFAGTVVGDPISAGKLEAMSAICGPLPASLSAFWRVVGSLDFSPGRGVRLPLAPETRAIALDPLVVYAPSLYEATEWQERVRTGESSGEHDVWIAPDRYHKQEASGGAPYSIAVPSKAADARVDNVPMRPYFVAWLRDALALGGFPGARSFLTDTGNEWLAGVTAGIEPF